jgi:hypothetical protein
MTAWISSFTIRAEADEADSATAVVIFSLLGLTVSIGVMVSLPTDMATAVLDALSR